MKFTRTKKLRHQAHESATTSLFTNRVLSLRGDERLILRVAKKLPLVLQEIDVDSSAQWVEEYGNEVPVLFINGRKAFKYRVTQKELEKKLSGSD